MTRALTFLAKINFVLIKSAPYAKLMFFVLLLVLGALGVAPAYADLKGS